MTDTEARPITVETSARFDDVGIFEDYSGPDNPFFDDEPEIEIEIDYHQRELDRIEAEEFAAEREAERRHREEIGACPTCGCIHTGNCFEDGKTNLGAVLSAALIAKAQKPTGE